MRVPRSWRVVGSVLVVSLPCLGCGEDAAGAGASAAGASAAGSGGHASGAGGAATSGGAGGGAAQAGGGGAGVPTECNPTDPALTDAEKQLLALPSDTWLEVPGTAFSSACDKPEYDYLHGVEGCGAVINDWCGAAWDPIHGQLLLWGGGHDGYWGNEVYGFDPRTMSWSVVKEPSPGITPDNQNKDPLDDGTPVSRHTYGGLAYLEHANRFWAWGGAMARNGFGTGLTWTLELETGSWDNLEPSGAPFLNPTGPYSMGSAYDPVTRKVFMQLNAGLSAYDYDANTWTPLLDGGYPPLYPQWSINSGSGVIDPERRIFFAFGGGATGPFAYDIDNGEHVSDQWLTTGADAMVTAYALGVDWDPAAKQPVGWAGGAPCELDMDTRAWTCLSASGAPAAQNANGTFGRWRYLSRYNVFILVNTPGENVHFYKHRAGCGD